MRHNSRFTIHDSRFTRYGFTFVETLLTILVISVIASVAAKVLLAGLDVYSLIVRRNEAFQTARSAMERMQDELIYLESSDVYSMAASNFRFYDTDGALTRFWRTNCALGQLSIPCVKRGSDFLAGNVNRLNFGYYKLDGSPTTLPADLRRISIDLIVQAFSGEGTVHLKSNVFPRNFMYSGFQ